MAKVRRPKARPGASPGIELHPEIDQPPPAGTVTIHCVDYGPERLESFDVEDLEAFLAKERPGWARVRWINVDGLHPYVVNRLRKVHPFHTLAAEDALHVPQRSKLEPYEGHLFLVAHMAMVKEDRLTDEQVSFIHFTDTLITFQERPGDVWDPVRKRLEREGSRLREGNTGYLLYALIDSLVDHFFPLLEGYGDRLEALEDEIVDDPRPTALEKLYGVKRELIGLRRVMWPMREAIDSLQRLEHPGVDKETQTYLRDVYDHALRVIDMIETYREMAAGLTDLYMSAISNRMNEIMKVLTIMASLFIPITFIAGVYGMNFEHIPELSWPWSYAVFWTVCLSVTASLLVYFRRKGWIG